MRHMHYICQSDNCFRSPSLRKNTILAVVSNSLSQKKYNKTEKKGRTYGGRRGPLLKRPEAPF